MPQDDLLPVHGGSDGGDRRIACETDPDIPDSSQVNVHPDFPPESFWLSQDAEFDWFDRNAFLERKESKKGNSNSTDSNPNLHLKHSNSSSQRFSMNLKSKATIIGLPKTTYVDSKRRRCRPANIRLFPKRSNSGGKSATVVSLTEPSSPKVSCIGRVRSKRCRSRRKSCRPATELEKSVSQQATTGKGQKTGIISQITSFFQSKGQRRRKNSKTSMKANEGLENSASRRSSVTVKPVDSEPATPGLGGMTRFSSGRRSGSWGVADDTGGAGHRIVNSQRR